MMPLEKIIFIIQHVMINLSCSIVCQDFNDALSRELTNDVD